MKWNRWTRPLAPLALALALVAGLAPSGAFAAEPPPGEPPVPGEGSGRSLDGYFATAALTGLVMFIVCKSARRS